MSRAADKPALSQGAQVALLRRRVLGIDDERATRAALLNWNYYRLSGYFRQFQVDPSRGDDRFLSGVSFGDVIGARHYDVELASVLLDGLLEVERVVRSRLAHYLALRHGNAGFYLRPGAYLPVMGDREAFAAQVRSELVRSRSRTVARYAREADLAAVPVWVAIELCSFGVVSRMVTYLVDREPVREVAASLSVPWGTFPSTVHGLSYARNVCAHHGQFWHRWMTVQTPVLPKERRTWGAFDHRGPVPVALATIRLLRAVDRGCPRARRIEDVLRRDSPYRDGVLRPDPR